MKSVAEVLAEPSPSTVNYRSEDNDRAQLQDMMDNTHDSKPQDVKKRKNSNGQQSTKLDWKSGVFVPVLLNIWGVIMFLRLGWVVGQAGLINSTLIVIAANVVNILTTLSLCAICTNGEVKGGGVYYLISRALGPVYGGTIGILFFVAQAIATSIYVIGFAEAVVDLVISQGGDYFTGSAVNDFRVIGLATSCALLAVALVGIGWYAKTQKGLLAVLILAIISVFVGAFLPRIPTEGENIEAGFVGFDFSPTVNNLTRRDAIWGNFQFDPSTETKQGFFSVFGVFFPAVTGIMAGANLSGDLKDPSKAIPKGTLGGIGLTFVSYIALVWFLGLTCLPCSGTFSGVCSFGKTLTEEIFNQAGFELPDGGLLYNRLILKNISVWEPLVYIGVFAATLSSSLASLVGAPRILQSVAGDKILPFEWFTFFAAGKGANKEPIRGYFLTFGICCAFVALGNLDVIAPIITNFFMISYALTNYACFLSTWNNAPSWRPSFKYYSIYTSGVGAILCVVVMFLLNWIVALVTCVFALLIMVYIDHLDPDISWGEAGESQKYSSALKNLEVLQTSEQGHVKTFRPQFLVLTGSPYKRLWLVKFMSLFSVGGGIMICGEVIQRTVDMAQVPGKKPEDGSQREGEASVPESSAGNGNDKGGQRQTVMDLFTEDGKKPSLTGGNGREIKIETAKALGTGLQLIKTKREEAERLLTSSDIWQGPRCKGAFYEAVISNTLQEGFESLLHTAGIGKMRPNTVVLGFMNTFRDASLEEVANYERTVRLALSSNIGVLIVRDDKHVFDMNLKKAGQTKFFDRLSLQFKGDALDDDYSADENEAVFKGDFSETLVREERARSNASAEEEVTAEKANENKTRLEKYKEDDTSFIQEFEGKLHDEVSGDCIDVWWLADDGGLTVLLPQLLHQNPLFNKKSIRVMAVTSKFHDVEETSKLKKTEMRMIHLLHKFRIEAKTVGVDIDMDQELMEKTKKKFKESMSVDISELDASDKAKTLYNLRVAEEIRKVSKNSSIVFVILPIPETNLKVKLHTTWLDIFSKNMPPTVMMRGNNQNVLTFFS